MDRRESCQTDMGWCSQEGRLHYNEHENVYPNWWRKKTSCETRRKIKNTQASDVKRQERAYMMSLAAIKGRLRIFTMQFGRTTDSCMTFMTETSSSVHRKNFLDVVIMVNNTHESGRKIRIYEYIIDKVAEIWNKWCRKDDTGQVL